MTLKEIADESKRQLATLAVVHALIKKGLFLGNTLECEILEWAKRVLKYPNVVDGGEGDLQVLLSFAASTQFGYSPVSEAYFNRSAVVYADAILQGFLARSFSVFSEGETLCCRSVVSMMKEIAGNGKGMKHKHRVEDLGRLPAAKHARFLAKMRNAIVHDLGDAERFLRDVGADSDDRSKWLWDTTLWPSPDDLKKLCEDQATGSLVVPMDVEKVVIPYFRRAYDFVCEAEEAFVRAAERSAP